MDTPGALIEDTLGSLGEEEETPSSPAAPAVNSPEEEEEQEESEAEEREDIQVAGTPNKKPSPIAMAAVAGGLLIAVVGGYVFFQKKGNTPPAPEPPRSNQVIQNSIIDPTPPEDHPSSVNPPRAPVVTDKDPKAQGKNNTQPPNQAAQTPPQGTRTIAIPNLGGENLGIDKAAEEILKGNPKDITWVTNTALEPIILQTLREALQKKARILVVCGRDALEENLKGVGASGIALTRSSNPISPNMSLLFIDGKKIVDISNPELVWVTVEPAAVKSLSQWFWVQHNNTRPLK